MQHLTVHSAGSLQVSRTPMPLVSLLKYYSECLLTLLVAILKSFSKTSKSSVDAYHTSTPMKNFGGSVEIVQFQVIESEQ
jgi:hypothetical protein